MQHRIPITELGARGEAMAQAVSTCVHCGFCLASCPTYQVLGEEMDSPRGRIMLMKQALEGDLSDRDVQPYVDRCLGCLACETACPSGVKYRDLVVPYRARLEGRARPWHDRRQRQTLLSILESPTRFRMAHKAARIARRLLSAVRIAPRNASSLLSLLPAAVPAAQPLPSRTPAAGARRARVALLAGCVQQALRPSINLATIRVLTANGIEVVVPPDQGCCGALALHVGEEARALALAARNRIAFRSDVDAIVVNAAGCGSAMKEQQLPARVLDVAELLDDLGVITPFALPQPAVAAYHDACHLAHGQGIRSAPRRLLGQVANLTLAEINDGEMCCGSAGVYNLEQPQTARELGRRKATAIRRTGADMVVTGNIGCITQIAAHLAVPVHHTIEILDSSSTKN